MMKWRVLCLPLLALLLALLLGTGTVPWQEGAAADSTGLSRQILSRTYEIDQKYRSMMGPASVEEVRLLDAESPELLWITGYEAVMVGADGETPMSQEYMCHSNLDFDPRRHNELFGAVKPISSRLFTLSQGQLSIRFPEGFGLPMLSSEPLSLTTQVLALNEVKDPLEVRHKVTVHFERDQELRTPIRPLFQLSAYGLVSLEDQPAFFGGHRAEMTPPGEGDHGEHGTACLVGQNAATGEYKDHLGKRFSGHWVVPPGRHVYKTLVTQLMSLPFDTTVHYIAVHLHPFAESLELVDLTSGETVFRSRVRPAAEGIGIEHVEYFSSIEGVPLYRDREYELTSVYNNTSSEDQDSMAVMYMYLLDQEFDKPNPDSMAAAR